ncbi:hypothetical protein [Streptomyces sp. NPDC049040]|uniref:hypothetical protein n=1 Tax=Streptomyces sp. NPDC049040 TaxID=3365593 RepID=UPI0037125DBC
MAPTQWQRQRKAEVAEQPAPGGTVLRHGAEAPVFAALADQWRSAGRMVPGQTDTEWAELVGRMPRLVRR